MPLEALHHRLQVHPSEWQTYADHALKTFAPNEHTATMKLVKRAVDVIGASLLLLLLTPALLPIVSLAIALESKGGVFFKQARTGKAMRPFTCFKFRTMTPPDGIEILSDEERITRIGMFLRKTHIDELPQLINVLKGEMSLVGPRPHMLSDTRSFESKITNYHVRHILRPGITGLAQVNGYFGSVVNSEHLQRRVQYDIDYVFTWSIRKDVSILIRTLTLPFKANN